MTPCWSRVTAAPMSRSSRFRLLTSCPLQTWTASRRQRPDLRTLLPPAALDHQPARAPSARPGRPLTNRRLHHHLRAAAPPAVPTCPLQPAVTAASQCPHTPRPAQPHHTPCRQRAAAMTHPPDPKHTAHLGEHQAPAAPAPHNKVKVKPRSRSRPRRWRSARRERAQPTAPQAHAVSVNGPAARFVSAGCACPAVWVPWPGARPGPG